MLVLSGDTGPSSSLGTPHPHDSSSPNARGFLKDRQSRRSMIIFAYPLSQTKPDLPKLAISGPRRFWTSSAALESLPSIEMLFPWWSAMKRRRLIPEPMFIAITNRFSGARQVYIDDWNSFDPTQNGAIYWMLGYSDLDLPWMIHLFSILHASSFIASRFFLEPFA